MFDEQLSKMYQLIDMQLSKMAHIAPHDQVVRPLEIRGERVTDIRREMAGVVGWVGKLAICPQDA